MPALSSASSRPAGPSRKRERIGLACVCTVVSRNQHSSRVIVYPAKLTSCQEPGFIPRGICFSLAQQQMPRGSEGRLGLTKVKRDLQPSVGAPLADGMDSP